MISVDKLDYLLIRCLQENPRGSYATIARMTNASETTVKRRVEALIEGGVITTAVFPNPRKLGYQVQAQIGIRAEPNKLEEIALTLRDFPEVAFVALALGRYDLLVYVVVPGMEQLTRFVVGRLSDIPGVISTDTTMTPRIYKAFANWRVPIDDFIENADPGQDDTEEQDAEDGAIMPLMF